MTGQAGAIGAQAKHRCRRPHSAFASSRSADAELTQLDSAYRYLMEWIGEEQTLKADDKEATTRAALLADSCDVWLEAGKARAGAERRLES